MAMIQSEVNSSSEIRITDEFIIGVHLFILYFILNDNFCIKPFVPREP